MVIAVFSTAFFTTAPSHGQHQHSSSLIRRNYRFTPHLPHTPYQQRSTSSTPNPPTPQLSYLSPNPLPNPHRSPIRQSTHLNFTSTISLKYHPHGTSFPFPLPPSYHLKTISSTPLPTPHPSPSNLYPFLHRPPHPHDTPTHPLATTLPVKKTPLPPYPNDSSSTPSDLAEPTTSSAAAGQSVHLTSSATLTRNTARSPPTPKP